MRSVTSLLVGTVIGIVAGGAVPTAARGQEANLPLEIGAVAPDFALPGATRFGLLAQPVRLSDYQGELVVLAFFFKARTKG